MPGQVLVRPRTESPTRRVYAAVVRGEDVRVRSTAADLELRGVEFEGV